MDYLHILHTAINSDNSKPKSKSVYEALLNAEKKARQEKNKYEFNQLLGNWRLVFITGTKSSQKKLGGLWSSGFYLPPFVKVMICYTPENNLIHNQGRVENKVQVGLVNFSVTGPIKYFGKKNILAFDFNHLIMSILGVKTYETDIREGVKSENKFYEGSVNRQAFFSYFLVTEDFIAARGRGGGLALWKKES